MKFVTWFVTCMAALLWVLLMQTAVGCMFFGWKREGSDLLFVLLALFNAVVYTVFAMFCWLTKPADPS